MAVTGIGWHATVVDNESFDATRAFFGALLGTTPGWEAEGFTAFHAPDGSSLELLAPQHVPNYGLNSGAAFGFIVNDLDETTEMVRAAGGEILGEKVETASSTYQHFRAPDGRVYGLTELVDGP